MEVTGDWREKVASQMCEPFAGWVRAIPDADAADATELRFRVGARPFVCMGGREAALSGQRPGADEIARLVTAMCGYSLYSYQRQLAEGYVTLRGGFRAGVTGTALMDDGRCRSVSAHSSVCVRVAREAPGCAEAMLARAMPEGPRSLLIISPPGLGKTTMLRDALRILSARGVRCAVADERGELAALWRGQAALDVGERTDVLDGCPKHMAIRMLLRAMAPQVIAADEIGSERDAEAVLDASRCGVKVIATAHGESIRQVMARRGMEGLSEAFEAYAVLGGGVGELARVKVT